MKTMIAMALGGMLVLTARAEEEPAPPPAPPPEKSSRTEHGSGSVNRAVAPVVVETREKQVDAATTSRTETILQPRSNAGGYVEAGRATTMSRQVDENTTETRTDVVQIDRQGQARATLQLATTVTKTADGEQRHEIEFTRNSSGALVPGKEVMATTVKDADGISRTVRFERGQDMNGNLALKQRVEETETPLGENTKQTVTRVSAPGHVEGSFGLLREETKTTRADGNVTYSDTVVRTPRAGSLVVTAKIATTETRGPDGAVQREMVEQGEPMHSRYSPTATESLQPQRRVVERETRGTDGAIKLEREVYRRDVNGDWKRESFSLEDAARVR